MRRAKMESPTQRTRDQGCGPTTSTTSGPRRGIAHRHRDAMSHQFSSLCLQDILQQQVERFCHVQVPAPSSLSILYFVGRKREPIRSVDGQPIQQKTFLYTTNQCSLCMLCRSMLGYSSGNRSNGGTVVQGLEYICVSVLGGLVCLKTVKGSNFKFRAESHGDELGPGLDIGGKP